MKDQLEGDGTMVVLQLQNQFDDLHKSPQLLHLSVAVKIWYCQTFELVKWVQLACKSLGLASLMMAEMLMLVLAVPQTSKNLF